MAEEKKFPALVGMYVGRVLDGMDIEKVPAMLRDQVREEVAEKDKYVNLYAAKVLKGGFLITSVPSTIREEVQELVNSVDGDTSVALHVAWMLEGKKQLSDVPESIREEVKNEIEEIIGKKLDSGE